MEPDPFMPGARGGGMAFADRVWQRVTARPSTFLLAPFAVSLAGALVLSGGTPGARPRMLVTAALYAAWVPLWVRQRRADPDVRRPLVTVALGAVAAVLVAQLMAIHLMFGLTVVVTMFNLFVAIPLWATVPIAAGVVYVVDVKFAEQLRRMPTGVPWSVVALHTLALVFLGTMVKSLASRNEERRRLLESLADVERRAGQAEERQRLAREIHDTLAQGFAGILRHLEAAALAVPENGASDLAAHLRRASEIARENLEEARRMMAALRPELLDGRALEEALRRVADDFTRRSGVPVSLTVTGEGAALHPEVEVTLLRASQEALANVARHARAATVSVTLSYMNDLVALDVRDDGQGIAAAGNGAPGFGLRAMRERAELLGGTLAVESAAREGTTVSVALPRVAAERVVQPREAALA